MWFKKIGKTKKIIKVGEISEKDDILTVGKKWISLIGNKTKRSLEMTPWKIELEPRLLKVSKMWIQKRLEKEKELLSEIGGENLFKNITGEASKGY